MNAKLKLAPLVAGIALALMVVPASLTHAAPILWTGSSITFSQTVANSTSRDVIIPGAVELTRNNSKWLFNPAGGDPGNRAGSPANTLWAFATNAPGVPITSLAQVTNLAYKSFDLYRNGSLDVVLLGNKQMVMRIVSQDIYIPVKFTAWPGHAPAAGTGRFAYIRSTAPPVSITNPPSGAVFAAPAIVQVQAATAMSGLVTNVEFLSNGVSLGSDPTAPFSITTGSLAAGPYALTAVATAAGISATSSVVNITVVSPVNILLTAPQVTNNVFSFDYTANPGLRYVVQNSLNLTDWLSVVTNVAAGSPVHYTSPFLPNGARYYRVGRLPNP